MFLVEVSEIWVITYYGPNKFLAPLPRIEVKFIDQYFFQKENC